MQLILWRHASANSFNGYDRMLDPTGHKQAAQGGQWLAAHYPNLPILTSMARRAIETAAHYPFPSEAVTTLNPGKATMGVYDFLLERSEDALIAVGHLPWIGQLGAHLLRTGGYYPFNHGMVLVFASDDGEYWQLRDSFQPQPVTG